MLKSPKVELVIWNFPACKDQAIGSFMAQVDEPNGTILRVKVRNPGKSSFSMDRQDVKTLIGFLSSLL